MKILFTGGGTGGHFYPIIAITEALRERAKNQKILMPELYYMAPTEYNPRALFDNELIFVPVTAGKIRRYFSLLNFFDLFKTAWGVCSALSSLYKIYPDVVFGKGGYASFPTLFAARLLRIPVVIHESDSVPGRVNTWAGKFARKIAISYPEAAQYFKNKDRVAFTGNPIRKEIIAPLSNGAHEFLGLEQGIPTILVLGGSQGSQVINDAIVESLPKLLENYQVIHQTGKNNYKAVEQLVKLILDKDPNIGRYKSFDYLNDLALRMSAGIADVVISRAGSTIFEIAAWGVPSIIIPLSEKISHDQTKNAFAYARSGACMVIEEQNISDTVLTYEIDTLIKNTELRTKMKDAAHKFSRLDSADIIAQALLEIALEHE
ncbi:MAG: undecaprenyldiphospho-muramoylpentapeptide beta-N-acetylglucosaminyltransferase [Candidatus Taylorbacteria bacterium]|nr:undecaprenyldiphospho-muramoylpentapeptide beta-N-acetylglucosaminyltransferase [Candidatus Taylorbacteria bacterium]